MTIEIQCPICKQDDQIEVAVFVPFNLGQLQTGAVLSATAPATLDTLAESTIRCGRCDFVSGFDEFSTRAVAA